jgi:hypothetical protein
MRDACDEATTMDARRYMRSAKCTYVVVLNGSGGFAPKIAVRVGHRCVASGRRLRELFQQTASYSSNPCDGTRIGDLAARLVGKERYALSMNRSRRGSGMEEPHGAGHPGAARHTYPARSLPDIALDALLPRGDAHATRAVRRSGNGASGVTRARYGKSLSFSDGS